MKRLLVALLLLVPTVAVAQDVAPATPATFLTIVIGSAITLLTTIFVPLAILWGRQMIAERQLKLAQIQEQLSSKADAGTQKAIGGALGKIEIPEGKLPAGMKNQVVADAAKTVLRNFSDTLTNMGVEAEDQPAKVKEMVESRLGLMDAQAAGNPVPNPSQPLATPSTQSVTVSPTKK